MMKGILIFGLIVVLLAGGVYGLGVMPARVPLEYKPGSVYEGSVVVSNPEGKMVSVSVRGDLSKYILVDQGFISDNKSFSFDYKFLMPKNLPPGMHKAELVFTQSSEAIENSVQANLAVVSEVSVYVPFPGKYVLADLFVKDAGAKWDSAEFIVPVNNLGKADLSSVRAFVDIYNSKGLKVGSVKSEEVSLDVGEKKDLKMSWVADVDVGEYLARASVVYDGKSLKFSKRFNVGGEILSLEDVRVREFSLGEIAKFEMLIENKWPKRVEGVYSVTQIFDEQGNKLDEFKSQQYDLEGLSRDVLVSYWDSKGFKEGRYKARIVLKYGDKSASRELLMDVGSNSLRFVGLGKVVGGRQGYNWVVVLLGVLVVLLIVIILVIIRGRIRKVQSRKRVRRK